MSKDKIVESLSDKIKKPKDKNLSVLETNYGHLCKEYINREECKTIECVECPHFKLLKPFADALEQNLFLSTDFYQCYNKKEKVWDYQGIEDVFRYGIHLKECLGILMNHNPPRGWIWSIEPKRLRMHLVAIVIIKDLIAKGIFIQDVRFDVYYYYSEVDNTVFIVSQDGKELYKDFDAYLSEIYGLFGHDGGISKHVLRHAIRHHEKREVQRLFYFDKTEKNLYIFNGEDGYYCLDGDNITDYPNGKYHLFRGEYKPINENQPNPNKITYLPPDQRPTSIDIPGVLFPVNDILLDTMANRTNFVDRLALSKKEQCVQLAIQLHTYPFLTSLRTKPIAAAVGPEGSGKSFLFRTLGIFLYEVDYEVFGLPDSKDDFIISLVNNPICFFDNVETRPGWLEDILASVATGVRLPKRLLYTTWDESKATPKCHIGLTSRDPKYKRNDVIDRLLIYNIDRFFDYLEEEGLLTPLIEHRSLLWSLYMDNLNKIVKVLKTKQRTTKRTKHRLADWANLATTIDQTLGIAQRYGINFDSFMNNINNERAAFAFQDHPILPLLKRYLDEHGSKWLTANELYTILSTYDEKFPYKSPTGLAKRINMSKVHLATLFGLIIRNNSSTNAKEYCFGGVKDDSPKQGKLPGLPSKEGYRGVAGTNNPFDLFMIAWDSFIQKNKNGDEKGISLEDIKDELPYLTQEEIELDLLALLAQSKIFKPKEGFYKPI